MLHSEQIEAVHLRRTAKIVHRLLHGLVSFTCQFPRLVLTLALLCAAISTCAFYTRLEYRTQRSDLINPHKEHQQRWRQYLAEFGDDDDMVVVVRGSDTQQMKNVLDSLGEKIQQQPDRFDRLFYKVDLRHLQSRALLLLPREQIQQIHDNISRMKQLLDPLPAPLARWVDPWKLLTLQSLLQEADMQAIKLDKDQPLSLADEQFWKQLAAISRAATVALEDPSSITNPWRRIVDHPSEQENLLAEPQYFFSGDKELAFLLVRPVKIQGSFTGSQPSVDALRAIIDTQRNEHTEVQYVMTGLPVLLCDEAAAAEKEKQLHNGLDFGLTGLPVLESDEMVAAEKDTRLAMWLAIAGVTALFLVVYRGIYYPLLTVATLLIGTAWAMGWMTLTVGHVNILSATFAVMLVGMGDYGVLWVMRYEQARQLGSDVRTALLHTTTHVAIGNLTAAMTLALAFYAAMLADFHAVMELGWIAGSGVLLCALACFTVLPSMLMLFDRRPLALSSSDRTPSPILRLPFLQHTDWMPWLFRRPGWIVATGLLLTVVLGACTAWIKYDHNLLHLQPRGLDSVKTELTLINHTAGASFHAISYTDTAEEALALKARYEKLPEVGRVVEVASLVPPDQDVKIALLADIQRRLRRLPPRGVPISHAKPKMSEIASQLVKLTGHLRPLTAGGNQPVLEEVRNSLTVLQYRLYNAADGTEMIQHLLQGTFDERLVEERLQAFDQRLAGYLAEDLHQLRDVSTPAPITVADLPPALRERYIGKNGKWLLQIFPAGKDSLWEFDPLKRFIGRIQTVDPNATGKPFTTVEGLSAMKNGLEWAGLYAFVAIVLVLVVDFRDVRVTLLALAPLVMGVLLSLGIMGLCGVPLNPANMIAFPLILGVGVDNGVHVLHDYLLRRRENKSTISHAIGRGVLIKALTTIIGFGTLMVSRQRGLVGLGFILTLGVTCCMLTALVFLPAVLRLWAGKKETAVSIEIEAESRRLAA